MLKCWMIHCGILLNLIPQWSSFVPSPQVSFSYCSCCNGCRFVARSIRDAVKTLQKQWNVE